MKTTERNVIVEITDNGKLKRHVYSIATGDGELMTHRLKRLLSGKIGHKRGDFYGERYEIHFMGLVWAPPYRLLQEVLQDRIRLQRELFSLEGESELTQISPAPIPEKASDTKISTLLLRELDYRASIKARIRELERTKGKQTRERFEDGGGWIQP